MGTGIAPSPNDLSGGFKNILETDSRYDIANK
jgi:hypothetical protein